MVIADLDCLGLTLFDNRLERTSEGEGESEIYELMHTQREGYAYNELVTHLPLHALASPERVLILGGGTLFTAREALRHPSVQEVDVVDYDPAITAITLEQYEPSLREVRDNPRVRLHSEDVRDYLGAVSPRSFDVVIDDLIDVVRKRDQWVFELFPAIASALRESGLYSTYLYPSWYHLDLNRTIISRLRRAGFKRIMATAENVFHYSWPEGLTSYICAAKTWPESLDQTRTQIQAAFLERQIPTKQFRPDVYAFTSWA